MEKIEITPAQKFILKYDLNYSMSEQEQQFIDVIELSELRMLRKQILDQIRAKKLPIDKLEKTLEELMEEEYSKYIEGLLQTENLKLQKINMEKEIYKMIRDISERNVTLESLNNNNLHKKEVKQGYMSK